MPEDGSSIESLKSWGGAASVGAYGRQLFGTEAHKHRELYSRREDRTDYNYSSQETHSLCGCGEVSSSELSVGPRDGSIETRRKQRNRETVNTSTTNNQDYIVGKGRHTAYNVAKM